MKWVQRKVREQVHVLRVDMATPLGKEVMERYRIPLNSSYVIFDAAGREVWRSYAIPLNGHKVVKILMGLPENADLLQKG